jgi:hypothetical protein
LSSNLAIIKVNNLQFNLWKEIEDLQAARVSGGEKEYTYGDYYDGDRQYNQHHRNTQRDREFYYYHRRRKY